MRRFGLILAAAVLLATGVAGSSAAGGSSVVSGASASIYGATSSALSSTDRQAKKKAMKKCGKKSKRSRRAACAKRVKKRFRTKPVKSGTQQGPVAATIDVRDKYFAPDDVNIKSGESVLWVWNPLNKDAHNVDLTGGPAGVKRLDFTTPITPSVGYSFRRTFTTPGTYSFVCSIHYLMTMTVKVSK